MWQSLNTGGKIGVVAGGLGAAAGVIAAFVAILSAPGEFRGKLGGLIFLIVFVLIFFLIFFFAFRKVFGPLGKQRKLQRTGLPADATILELRETGMTVNQVYPVVRLKLEVRPPGGQPYQAELQTLIDRLDVPRFQPGSVVAVKYDPSDPSNVALADAADVASAYVASALSGVGMSPDIAGGTIPATAAATPSREPERRHQMEEFLKKNDEESEDIRRTGHPAPAVIIQATPLNVFVNGRNPAMTFILDVQPEGQPAFQAQVTGVISEASVPRYQPGKIIHIKYDPANPSRVALDHS